MGFRDNHVAIRFVWKNEAFIDLILMDEGLSCFPQQSGNRKIIAESEYPKKCNQAISDR